MNLSALIIAKDEEQTIEDCLKQLSFVDEVIVLDQDSKDNTLKIAQKYADKIISSNREDFALNRNLLAKTAQGKWLLYIDCDERLSPDLIAKIQSIIAKPEHDAYYIPRKNFVLGKPVLHGGWWPDYTPRLFKKESLLNWQGKVHESPQIKSTFGYLNIPLVHLSARNTNFMLRKTIKWAKVEARLYHDATNPKITIIKLIKASTLEFLRRYILKRGFQDGSIGLIESIYQALHKSIIFTYLWEMQQKTDQKFEEVKRKVQQEM